MRNLIGLTFGWVHVAWFCGWAYGSTIWMVVCRCGKVHVAVANKLTKGRHTSCGCKQRVHKLNTSDANNHRLYSTWGSMKGRCYRTTHPRFKDYGGRTPNPIVMCQRFRESFDSFCSVVLPKPSPRFSIDRINNDCGYYCGDCEECRQNGWPRNWRWATARQQGRNTRRNRFIEFQGQTLTIGEWAKRFKVSVFRIIGRLNSGWSVDAALTTPPQPLGSWCRGRLLEFDGKSMYATEWARHFSHNGLTASTIHRRLKSGWSIADTLTLPPRRQHHVPPGTNNSSNEIEKTARTGPPS